MPELITLTTDFDLSDAYVASVKGVILSINPKAKIVDISHAVEPQNIVQAAFILHTVNSYFPDGTIHIVVVDPEVGSQRRAIVLQTPSAYFIAPDNGVLSYIIEELHPSSGTPSLETQPLPQLKKVEGKVRIVAINNPNFWHQPVSTTFHGRDIFAPVAAHLSLGIPIQEFGETIDSLYVFPLPKPHRDSKGNLLGQILHIDHFGNLITNIRGTEFPQESVTIEIGKQSIHGINQFYAEKEGLAGIIGSSGHLEISLNNGNAAAFLGAKPGDKIKLVTKKGK